MRKLYNLFFAVEEGEPIREKVLYARIGMYITVVLILMAAMSFVAFGYFTSDVESGSNNIATASYTLDIQVLAGDENLYNSEVLALEPGRYEIVLSYVKGSASTGFCIVEVGDSVYHTLQIGEDTAAENGFREQFSFTLTMTQPASVEFISSWGTSVYYGSTDSCYIQGDILTVG